MLKGAMDFLLTASNITLVLELHPNTYNIERNIKLIFRKLFESGYYAKYVETSAVPQPIEFKKNNFFPFKIIQNRGLYKNIPNEFLLNNAFEKKFQIYSPSLFNHNTIFVDKIIRSICITNE